MHWFEARLRPSFYRAIFKEVTIIAPHCVRSQGFVPLNNWVSREFNTQENGVLNLMIVIVCIIMWHGFVARFFFLLVIQAFLYSTLSLLWMGNGFRDWLSLLCTAFKKEGYSIEYGTWLGCCLMYNVIFFRSYCVGGGMGIYTQQNKPQLFCNVNKL